MAVAVSATGTATNNASAITQDFTFTVNASDTLVVFWIKQDANAVTINSVTWDQGGTNQSCSLIISQDAVAHSHGAINLYAVVNPTSGTKTLRVVQSATATLTAESQSYTGTVTTSVAAACTNALGASGNGSGTVSTAAQSGANGDYYIAGYTTDAGITSVDHIQVFVLSSAANDGAGNAAASLGSPITLGALVTAGNWAAVSCDIVASAAAANPFVNIYQPAPRRGRQGSILDNSFSLNPNLFKNPIPIFNQFEPAKPFNVPLTQPQPQIGININLFKNPIPFNQFDWSKPIRIPKALFDLSVALNLNLFKNPIPIFNGDGSTSKVIPDWLPLPTQPYNQNLYGVVIVNLPFNQYDYSKPFHVPSASFSVDVPYNQDLYQVVTGSTLMGQIWT